MGKISSKSCIIRGSAAFEADGRQTNYYAQMHMMVAPFTGWKPGRLSAVRGACRRAGLIP